MIPVRRKTKLLLQLFAIAILCLSLFQTVGGKLLHVCIPPITYIDQRYRQGNKTVTIGYCPSCGTCPSGPTQLPHLYALQLWGYKPFYDPQPVHAVWIINALVRSALGPSGFALLQVTTVNSCIIAAPYSSGYRIH